MQRHRCREAGCHFTSYANTTRGRRAAFAKHAALTGHEGYVRVHVEGEEPRELDFEPPR